jgi:colanic acid biosynthesis protein WcaH
MIEDSLYNVIVDNIPILCVDGVILSNNKILLLKRNNTPAKNEWWLPGGRVLKNEKLDIAILRKVKEETNLDVDIIEQLGISETIFESKHTVNVCYLLKSKNSDIILNCEHSKYNWYSIENLPNLDFRILEVIRKIKFI